MRGDCLATLPSPSQRKGNAAIPPLKVHFAIIPVAFVIIVPFALLP